MNPEFMRNLWSELSAHRLIAMPLVLGLVVAVAWVGGSAGTAAWVANAAIGVLLILWGARLSADSVLGEVVDRTWDSQRMSAIGPWAMTWGKLFGSTVYVWYGAFLCLVLAFVTTHIQGTGYVMSVPRAADRLLPVFDWWLPVKIFAAGVLAQALALFVALLLLRGRPSKLRLRVTLTQALAIAAASPFVFGGSLFFSPFTEISQIQWYGIDFPPHQFALITNLVFVGWAVFGCYCLMRLELQCRTGFLGWLCFTLFLPIYLAGIEVDRLGALRPAERALDWWLTAFQVTLALTYIAAFVEPKGILRLRRWLHDLATGSYERVRTSTPSWVVSGAICFICAVAAIALSATGADAVPGFAAFIVALMLFAVRDIALLYALTLDGRRRRGHLAALVYLAVLYVLLPALLAGAGLDDELIRMFRPELGGDPLQSTVPVAAQALAALALAAIKWRRLRPLGDSEQPAAA